MLGIAYSSRYSLFVTGKKEIEAVCAYKDNKLNQFQIFLIRAIIGLFVAVVITRMFTGEIIIPYIVGLATILVGLAYFSEYLRQRRNR